LTAPLRGRTAVVTGAGGNLGPIWCGALLEAGCTVVGLDRPGAGPDAGLDALEQAHPGRLVRVSADVADRGSVEAALTPALAELPPPSVLVNNAGIDQPPGPAASYLVHDYPAELFRGTLEVNVIGLFNVCQVVGRAMAEGGGGSIVNIGSLYASVSPDPRTYDHIPVDPPFVKPVAYGASKAAVVNLSRYLAVHWAAQRVRVNVLSPGGVLGRQDEDFKRKFIARVPLGRMAEAGDLVGPLLFLASDASAYVTGRELVVDGGYTAL
jgi:NAD(P)-dependent dehydrogenase (short-subunit alcohol dehydrogenase family)